MKFKMNASIMLLALVFCVSASAESSVTGRLFIGEHSYETVSDRTFDGDVSRVGFSYSKGEKYVHNYSFDGGLYDGSVGDGSLSDDIEANRFVLEYLLETEIWDEGGWQVHFGGSYTRIDSDVSNVNLGYSYSESYDLALGLAGLTYHKPLTEYGDHLLFWRATLGFGLRQYTADDAFGDNATESIGSIDTAFGYRYAITKKDIAKVGYRVQGIGSALFHGLEISYTRNF